MGMWLQLAVCLSLLALLPERVWSQIPSVCAKRDNFENSICCPDECGENGRCVDVQLPPAFDSSSSDVKGNWPHYFTRACKCFGNYHGVSCSRCKYGYFGETCTETEVIPRKSVLDLTAEDWSDYIKTIKMTRTYDSGYVVITSENPTGNSPPAEDMKRNVSLYNLFVWVHNYAARGTDYAHGGTGFPTWHRQYILWFEWEVQHMLKSMNRSDYHTFRFPYWDWRKERLQGTDPIFTHDKLGSTNKSKHMVSGELFDPNWPTICWRTQQEMCDPTKKTANLRRCPVYADGREACSYDNPDWPTEQDVNTAISKKDYDTASFDAFAGKSSFRNSMEGFYVDISKEDCTKNTLCTCGNDPNCENDEPRFLRRLHNAIHTILGEGYFGSGVDGDSEGVMTDVAASPNDPIFLNHHAMVDCILEEWLQKHPKPTYPNSDKQPSYHQPDAYIVPFFPLMRHRDVFKTADNFGYSCKIIEDPT